MALGGGLLVVMVAGTLLAWSGSSNPSAAARSTLGAPSEAPLELLSLEHTRAAGMLKITGVVRNRGRVGRIAGMSAVVFLFDTTGAFVTSARALVDYPTLAPGEESSFVIAVPGADNVSRYRVSFREDDRVVPHVDRRAARAPSATDSSQAR